MREFLTSQFGVSVVLAAAVIGVLLSVGAYCIYFERKISAFAQDRYGPNRVGPGGIFQLVADGLKLVFKEDFIPRHVDRPLFILAPAAMLAIGLIAFAAIPWGGQWELSGNLVDVQVAKIDIGLLYILGVASIAVYGIVLGGWASNNKYSFYGGIRAAAQMISYEIPMGFCILVVVLTMGTLRLETITLEQTGYWGGWFPQWNVFMHPLAFVILFITALAETNRTPFDIPEAEQELVGGYHTEYSPLKFGMFFLGEYSNMITSSAFISVLFLGGWHCPWISWTQPDATQWYAVLAKVFVLCGKVAFFMFLMMWLRWTLPRLRFDQLMRFAWQALIPITLGLFVLAAVLLYFAEHRNPLWTLTGNFAILVIMLIVAGLRRTEVTGRQINMPSVKPSSNLAMGMKPGVQT